MPRLLLVRHGITEFNSTRRFAGYSDIEISPDGYRQVGRLRDRLADEKIDAIYSSDLRRAMVTAGIIAAGRGVEIVTCSELREVNYGDAEGLTFDEIKRRYPELGEQITEFDLQMTFPNGEQFTGFIERTCHFLDRLHHHETSETVLIVSHGGPLRALICRLLDIDQSHWRQIRIDNASLSVMEMSPKRMVITLLNDISHLRGES